MMIVTRLFLFAMLCWLSACSSTPKVESRSSALRSPGSMSADEVREDLMRTAEDLGFYAVDVYPETESLRESETRLHSRSPDENAEATEIRVAAARSANTRLCFRIKLHVMQHYVTDLSRWEFVVVGSGIGEQKLEIEGLFDYRAVVPGSHHYRYATTGVACAYGNLEAASSFRMFVIPPSDWESMARPVGLQWRFL